MPTYNDVIQQALRTLDPRSNGRVVNLAANYVAASGTATFDINSPYFSEIRAGNIISAGLNTLYVYTNPNVSTGVTTVVGGYSGSTDINVANGTACFVSPAWPLWDVAQHVNQELDGLATPEAGLGQILTDDITFVPPFIGYDLGASFDTLRSRVLAVQYMLPPPDRSFPTLRRGEYRVVREQTNAGSGSQFPNGSGLIIYKEGFPGFPIHVTFTAPYVHLVNLTDDITTVGKLQSTAYDVLWMGTVLRIAPDREISRNAYNQQPDPRKAPEVPPGARMNSTAALERRYLRRRNEEASYYKRAFPQREGW